MMRRPSCLISCIQPVPSGGPLAGRGRDGPMLGQVRQNMDHSYRRTGAAGSDCLRHGRSYKIAPTREKTKWKCVEVLRRLAKEPDDPDCVVLAEQAINDYLKNEIEALRAAL